VGTLIATVIATTQQPSLEKQWSTSDRRANRFFKPSLKSREMTSRRIHLPDRSVAKAAISSSLLTPDYLDAVKVLSPETMSACCSLVLSNQDDAADNLLAMYEKCQKAADIIARDAPTEFPKPPLPPPLPMPQRDSNIHRKAALMSMPPPSRLMAPSSQSKTFGGGPAKGLVNGNLLSKTMLAKGRMMRPSMTVPIMRGKVARHHDMIRQDSNETSVDQQQRAGVTKIARIAGVTAAPSQSLSPVNTVAVVAGSVQAPPASALTFLANLNKDSLPKTDREGARKTSPKKEKKLKIDREEEDDDEEDVDNDEDDNDDDDDNHISSKPTKELPTRSQPPRSRRK
jgi:hypothetical protein